DLYRIRIGPLKIGDLPEGKWRALTDTERAAMIRDSK
ncbi:MAG TPA: rRNA pseudouridine synthase, partial [Verrucomicrobiae bacterium]|nr:rRNA pseudouridine synthase [Verrucomicrobiae bacterium]